MSWFRSCLVCVLLCALPGCGYTLKHRLKDAFESSKGIFVPVFDNETDEVGAEVIFTNALLRELQMHREVLLTNRENGGLELRGTLKAISIAPTGYTDPGFKGLANYRRLTSEMGVGVTLSLSLVDTKTQKVVWTKDFSGFQRIATPINRTYDYEAPSAVGPITQSLVDSLYPDIARLMMRDVYDEMVELF